MWIAYNFLSLQGSLQSFAKILFTLDCCELLTIFYLYKVLCSCFACPGRQYFVVNCLQFFIFTRFFAVNKLVKTPCNKLWIAYNFLSLQGSLQLIGASSSTLACCELLTIFYLYKVLCSISSIISLILQVVNCLQFFIFTRFFAVLIIYCKSQELLWIAYNFLSLQGSLQFFHIFNFYR